MAIPPELEIRQYASKHHFAIVSLDRTDTRMTVTFKEVEDLDEFLDEMVDHFAKRSGIDVDKHLISVVFIKREVPHVEETPQESE
jgi:hypothetical protein